ncbi:hypothetical protein HPB51_008194 [Rhipicephalus microplus]|uniref:DDE-1 domain-containing protein n=1 Tax=Rhipicephalus microplus TaxID=6941 RepID=A0A9J6EG14_RHIMP|nr:hypothetical protein HPB51_008194 [Rhipicephalus microplus]
MRNCPNIPVTYAWNKKAWMTRDIFLKWLKAWDSDLARQGRKGIIRTFKSNYKRRLIDILLVKLRIGQDLKIDLFGAIQMLKASWENVKQLMIANCFRHAGFGRTDEESVEESEEAGLACADEESELAETWSKLERRAL